MRPLLESFEGRLGDGLGPLAGPMRSFSGLVMGVQVGRADRPALPARARPVRPRAARRRRAHPPAAARARTSPRPRPGSTSTRTRSSPGSRSTRSPTPCSSPAFPGCASTSPDSSPSCWRGCRSTSPPRSLLRLPSTADLRELVERVRRGDLLQIVLGPERERIVARIQATMSLVEGHAEHVMDAVGAQVLGDELDGLRAALDERRATPLAGLAGARAPPRAGAEDAPVRGRPPLLRRGRASAPGWRRSTAPGAPRRRCRAPRSCRTPSCGYSERMFLSSQADRREHPVNTGDLPHRADLM